MTAEEIDKKETKYFRQFLVMCIIAIAIVIGVYFSVVSFTKTPVSPGEFGDLFGVCTCLFSGLAFCGLLYTVKIQKLELQITRTELQKTAERNSRFIAITL